MGWWKEPGAIDSQPALAWPSGLMARVGRAFPEAGPDALGVLARGFESYLFAARMWGPQFSVAMPSKSVDEVWHNAMLHSRFYEALCAREVGWFLHHDPGPLAGTGTRTQADADDELSGLARAWVGSCEAEGLDWRGSAQPSLFAADALVGVEDGFRFYAGKALGAGALAPIQERAAILMAAKPVAAKRRGLAPRWLGKLK